MFVWYDSDNSSIISKEIEINFESDIQKKSFLRLNQQTEMLILNDYLSPETLDNLFDL